MISPAYAQAAPAGGGDMSFIIMMVAMFAIMYFLIIRPQMKKAKEQKQIIESLQKGDEVITAGGVVGRITKISDAYVSLEIAPNTEISLQKAAIQVLLPKGSIKAMS